MSEIVFPWNQPAGEEVNAIKELKVLLSCPVLAPFINNPSAEEGKEIEGNPAQEYQIQLRQSWVVIYHRKSQAIIAFFLCNLNVYFAIREVKEFHQYSIKISPQKQTGFSLIQFAHSDHPSAYVTFLAAPQNKKTLEQFGIALEKCQIVQRDFHQKFKPLRKLGKGSTASVFSAIRLRDSAIVAIKAFNKSTHFSISAGKGKKAFQKELSMLRQSHHPNLCEFQGVYETDNTIYIVMKNYDRTLSSLIMTATSLPRYWVVRMMKELLKGVAWLHAQGIMHRDLKLENIMLNKGQYGTKPIIIDLGMAEYFQEENYLFEQCGTPGYAAPEVFGPRSVSPQKCDVFSLGVVFYIMLFKKPVFSGATGQQICANNKAGKLHLDMQLLNEEDQLVKDLLLKMLEVDCETRLSASEALKHELFNIKASPSLQSTPSEINGTDSISFNEI